MAPKTRTFYEAARKIVPSITKDRIFAKDIEAAAKWLKDVEWDFFLKVIQTVTNR